MITIIEMEMPLIRKYKYSIAQILVILKIQKTL